MNILLVGRGRVGSGLHRALRANGTHEVSVAGRNPRPQRVSAADAVILAVPDDAIEATAAELAPHLSANAAVLHCAGARSLDVLGPCKARGAAVGVMHPMVSFPSKSSSPSLRGATFTVNGDRKAVAVSRKIAAACGARVLVARTGDPAYHAAAALTANGAVALAYASVSVLQSLGIERRAAERAIGGLLETVGQNVQRLGVPAALTGPVARGEAKAITKHRSALRKTARGTLRSYDALVPLIVDCARAAGLSRAKANAILRTLER